MCWAFAQNKSLQYWLSSKKYICYLLMYSLNSFPPDIKKVQFPVLMCTPLRKWWINKDYVFKIIFVLVRTSVLDPDLDSQIPNLIAWTNYVCFKCYRFCIMHYDLMQRMLMFLMQLMCVQSVLLTLWFLISAHCKKILLHWNTLIVKYHLSTKHTVTEAVSSDAALG